MKNAFEYEAELTALREEIERLKAESFEELYNAAIDERDAAQKLNESLISRLKHFASCADVRQVGTLAMDFVATLEPRTTGDRS